MSQLTKQQLKGENQTQFPNNNVGAITPSNLRAFNVDMIDSTVNQTDFTNFSGSVAGQFASITASVDTGSLLTTASFNAFTQSINVELNTLESSASLALTTASFDNGTRNLTFTKGDSTTFSVNIPDVSGSTGNFATTGSNTFTGIQNFNADITASANVLINGDLTVNPATATKLNGNTDIGAFLYINGGLTMNTPAEIRWVGVSGSINSTFSQSVDARINAITGGVVNTGSFATTGSNVFIGNQTIGGNVALTGSSPVGITFTKPNGTESLRVGVQVNNPDTYEISLTGSSIQQTMWLIDNRGGTRYNTFPAPIISLGNVEIQNTLTASLQQGYVWVGDATGKTEAVPTSSFGGGGGSTNTGSLLLTASVNLNTLTFTKGDNTTFQLTVDTGSGGGQTFSNPSLESISGSLLITANTFNSGAANIAHISSSGNIANIIFKNNNNTASTIVSGSNNIFQNPTAPTTGYVRFINGNGNLFLLGAIPQLTASAASISGNRPTTTANIVNGTSAMTLNQSATPGTWTIGSNYFGGTGQTTINALGNTGPITLFGNVGAAPFLTLNSPSRSIAEVNAGATGSNALTIQNNFLAGNLNYNGPVSSSTHNINANLMVGNTWNMNVQSGSRSISVQGNLMGGGNSILNDNTASVFTSTTGHAIVNNVIYGANTFNSRASSSLSMFVNNIGGGVTITSDLDASSVQPITQRNFAVNSSILQNTIVYASGSMGAVSGSRSMLGCLSLGANLSASLVGDGSGFNMTATSMLGRGLTAIGTNAAVFGQTSETAGTFIAGRWNTEDFRARTSDIVFAVGTGTSGSAGVNRKTGFWIDSGSNTFVEGTLNVSGATSLNGNLIVTGSLTASLATGFMYVGNSLGRTEAIPTASFTASLATNATDIVVNVKNTTGAQINKGTVVRIIGATGDNALIGTASWEDDNNSANTLGFVVADIQNDGFGRVMTQGTLLAVNTDPALGFAAGDIVYLSGSGQYTNVKPPAPYHEVRLGQVLRAQQNNGSIYVLIQNGYELSELHDVDINTGSLANNDLLAYDSASTQWTNKSIASLGIQTTGSLNSGTVFATVSQSGSANVSQSIQFGVTGSMYGVSLVSGSQLQVADSGLYSLTISTQWVIDLTMDNVHLWVMKNGSNVLFSSQRQAYNGSFTIQDQANANDYYEFVWEGTQGDAVLQAANASGNIPATPCAIATIQQIR